MNSLNTNPSKGKQLNFLRVASKGRKSNTFCTAAYVRKIVLGWYDSNDSTGQDHTREAIRDIITHYQGTYYAKRAIVDDVGVAHLLIYWGFGDGSTLRYCNKTQEHAPTLYWTAYHC